MPYIPCSSQAFAALKVIRCSGRSRIIVRESASPVSLQRNTSQARPPVAFDAGQASVEGMAKSRVSVRVPHLPDGAEHGIPSVGSVQIIRSRPGDRVIRVIHNTGALGVLADL